MMISGLAVTSIMENMKEVTDKLFGTQGGFS